jgi:hypothetical protein
MNVDKQTISAMEAQPHPVLVPGFVTDLRQQYEEEIREYLEKVEKRKQEVILF